MTATTTEAEPPTTPTTPTGADAEQASLDWVDRIITDADGNDLRLLELLTEHLDVVDRHAERIRTERANAIVRLRDEGMSNISLKPYTGLSDSGIARAALSAGAPRRVDRRKGTSGTPFRRSDGAP